MIVPYPPGIPVVNPGEIIDEDVIEYVEDVLKAGGEVHGLIGGKFAVVAE